MGTPTKVIAIASIYLVIAVACQWDSFSLAYSMQDYEHRYSQSQYVMGDKRTMVMGDGDIYTYAGIRYVQGEDPTKINFEHPPLIKYLFGISYLLTGKPNWILVPLYYLAIFSFWYIASKTISKPPIRWLSLVLFLGHSTIYTSITQTMLDFPMTAILLLTLALYVSNLNSTSNKKMFGFGISSGLLLLSKYPFPLLLGLVGLLYIFLYFSKISLRKLALSITGVIGTYFIGYSSFFFHNNSLFDFFRFEWWRFKWFFGKTDSVKGMIWQTIFTGRYPKWWQTNKDYIYITHWNIYWPISFVIYLGSWTLKKVYQNPLFPYQIWIAISLLAYSFGVAEDRFLVPIIPGFALFGASLVEKLLISTRNGIIDR